MSKFTKHLIFIFFAICFFSLVTPCFSASIITSSEIHSAATTDEIPIHVKLLITTSNETAYYLRGVFFTEGSSNYCGYNWNGTTFYSGPYTGEDGWKNFLKVTITQNVWEGDMKVKIDADDSGCNDSGVYKFKVERFTESGSGTFDGQDPLSFSYILPTIPQSLPPTQKPTPTVKPTATPRPIPTTKSPTPMKITTSPSITAITSTSVAPESLHTPAQKNQTNYRNYMSTDSAVLGDATESASENSRSVSATPTTGITKVLGSSTSLWPLFFGTIGGGILVLCAILAFRIYKRAINT